MSKILLLLTLIGLLPGCAWLFAEGLSEPMAHLSHDRVAFAEQHGFAIEAIDLNDDEQGDIYRYYQENDPGNNNTSTAKHRQLVRSELDLNHDGRVDVVQLYNQSGDIHQEHSDLDFDGRIDIIAEYSEGLMQRQQVDLNNDGYPEVFKFYRNNNLEHIEWDTTGNGRIDRWEYYEKSQLDRIGLDSTGDGNINRWEYGPSHQTQMQQEQST